MHGFQYIEIDLETQTYVCVYIHIFPNSAHKEDLGAVTHQ